MDTAGLHRLAREARERVRSMKHKPQVLLIHDPVASRAMIGEVPLLLSGHTHNAVLEKSKGTVYVNAGTSGASGVRYFKNFEKPFYSLAVIDVTEGVRMTVDRVSILYADTMEDDFAVYTRNFR